MEKTFWSLLCTGDLWAVDRAGICDLGRSHESIENYTVKKWLDLIRIGTDSLKMVCADTKNKIIQ